MVPAVLIKDTLGIHFRKRECFLVEGGGRQVAHTQLIPASPIWAPTPYFSYFSTKDRSMWQARASALLRSDRPPGSLDWAGLRSIELQLRHAPLLLRSRTTPPASRYCTAKKQLLALYCLGSFVVFNERPGDLP